MAILRLKALLGGLMLALATSAAPAKVNVVAAENFYGDVASQIGGSAVAVTSILSSPAQDPHLFEASPSTGRRLAAARIAIANGLDYDPWMVDLLEAVRGPGRETILVADVLGKNAGANPHLWYDPANMSAFAKRLAASLAAADPAHAGDFRRGEEEFQDSLRPLEAKIAAMRAKYAGWPVTATEPVFGYMAARLGLAMRNGRFQLAVMNDTEPGAAEVAAFESDLRGRKVKAMIFNTQADDQPARLLLALARNNHVPAVGVTETEPPGETYQSWMIKQLEALDHALSESGS